MKLTKKLRSLRQTDEEMHRQITEAFPPDWDMDSVLERSLRNYRERTAGTAPAAGEPAGQPAGKRRLIPHFTRRIAAAACLIVAVGVAGIGLYLQHTRSSIPSVMTEPASTSLTAMQTTAADDFTQHTVQTTCRTELTGTGGQTAIGTEQTVPTDTTPSVSGETDDLSTVQTDAPSDPPAEIPSDTQMTATATVTRATAVSPAVSETQTATAADSGDTQYPPKPGSGVDNNHFRLTYPENGIVSLTCSGYPPNLRQNLTVQINLAGYSLTEEQTANREQERQYLLYGPWGSTPVRLRLRSYASFDLRCDAQQTVQERCYFGDTCGYLIHDRNAAVQTDWIFVWDTGEFVAEIDAGDVQMQAYFGNIVMHLNQ